MNTNEKKLRRISILVTLLLLLFALGGVSFAWFTNNRVTSTNLVRSKTGDDNVELYVSSQGAAGFKNAKEAGIVKVNAADQMELMPVSTADLKRFVYSPAVSGRDVSSFMEDKDGKYYYHGRFFIKAEAKGEHASSKMDLYFEGGADKALVVSKAKEILNASRVGITFDGASPVIFSLSDDHNVGDEDYRTNTIVNGQTVNSGNVLSLTDSGITAVADPSVKADDYTISISNGAVKQPGKKLLSMDMNKIYTVDVYFYLEGTDPDCTIGCSMEEVDMQFYFYGVLN